MTARKAVDQKRRDGAKKRKLLGESALIGSDSASDERGIEQVVGDAPTPELVAIMTEEFRRLLDRLGDPELEELALGKMEGYTNDEIADQHECSVRTVERRLQLIRKKWDQEQPR